MYRIHLKASQEWGSMWHVNLDSIHESINQEWEKKYKTIGEKLEKLVHTQTKKKPQLQRKLLSLSYQQKLT